MNPLPVLSDREYFHSHRYFESKDLDEAREVTSRLWRPHQSDMKYPHEAFFTRHNCVQLDQFRLSYVRCDNVLSIKSVDAVGLYQIHFALNGASQHKLGKRVVTNSPESAFILSASYPAIITTASKSRKLILAFTADALMTELAHCLGHMPRNPLLFEPTFDLRKNETGALLRLISFLCHEVEQSDSLHLHSSLAIQQLERSILYALLDQHPHNYSNILHSPIQSDLEWRARLVEEFILANLDRPLSMGDLCALTNVSARALQACFRRYRGYTPMQFLKRARLEKARQDLLADTEESVGEIAVKWGFYHLGRFSADYRREYGELPSETRRKKEFNILL